MVRIDYYFVYVGRLKNEDVQKLKLDIFLVCLGKIDLHHSLIKL